MNAEEHPILSISGWFSSPAHLVLSLPKCGGNAMVETLRRAFPTHVAAYVHAVSREGLQGALDYRWREMFDDPAVRGHLNEAREAKMMIEERRARFGSPIGYYLCGVRDPIGLAVSGFFQGYGERAAEEREVTAEFITDYLLNTHPVLTKRSFFKGGFEGWFDREIRGELGIDVFEHPFDWEKGYSVIRKGGTSVLVIRQENFESLSQGMSDLYDMPSDFFRVAEANRAKDKDFAKVYETRKAEIGFDAEVLDEFYGGRYSQHFYSDDELDSFRQNWSNDRA